MKWNFREFFERNDPPYTLFYLLVAIIIAILIYFGPVRGIRHQNEQEKIANQVRKEIEAQKKIIMKVFDGEEVTLEKWMFDSPLIESVAEEWCFNHGIAANRMNVESRRLADKLYAIINHNKISLKQHPTETITNEREVE